MRCDLSAIVSSLGVVEPFATFHWAELYSAIGAGPAVKS
jgi:hypothetical protein